ncbi:MAG: sugar O-acetyltransferase, partial [Rhodothermales bacterium]
MTEREKMLSGAMYDAADPELAAARRRGRDLVYRLNHSEDREKGLRRDVFEKLFGAHGEELWIEPPFYCDYGSNISLGDRVYFNFNCVVLDPAEVVVGDDVLFGPAAQIYTATHPLSAKERSTRKESARPVCIESGVWIGG